jgi:nucleoside-triphosphatase THEP1
MENSEAARIIILTGPVHAGKTSFLRNYLQDTQKQGLRVNGILSVAAFRGQDRIGYDAHDLRSGESYPLLRTSPEPGWLRVGPFGMIPEGFDKAAAAVIDTARSDLTVIDEMGPLELAGRGFWSVFLGLEKKKQPALVVVRSDLVTRFQEAIDGITHVIRLHDADLAEHMSQRLASTTISARD